MDCAQVRKRLTDDQARTPDAGVLEHLGECPGCSRFAQRLQLAEEVLRAAGDVRKMERTIFDMTDAPDFDYEKYKAWKNSAL